MSSKGSFAQISPSEFFYKNRDLAGFSNPTRSLYTAVREFVENALDACDQQGILHHVRYRCAAPEVEHFDITVEGLDPHVKRNRSLSRMI